MLPPVDPSMRSTNPKFDALYNDLCQNKLNPDGTSKLDAKGSKERDTLGEESKKARTEAAKREIVKTGLQDLSYRHSSLPEELQELVAVIAMLLEGQIPDDDRDLLQGDIAKFKGNINTITAALTERLDQDAEILASVFNPEDPPSLSDLSSKIEDMKISLTTSRARTAESRSKVTQEATRLHDVYAQTLTSSIRILEQTIHGSVARGTKAKAEYLATVAEGMSKKLGVQYGQLMGQVYSPEVQEALQTRRIELELEIKRMKRRVREAEEHLEEYSGGGLEDVAREYAEVLAEGERVRREVERLKSEK